MKKKFMIATFLLIGFVFALSFFSKDESQPVITEEKVKSKPSTNEGKIIFKGENDFWDAEFFVEKNSVNQLKIRHKQEGTDLPTKLTFTLMTAYDQNLKQRDISAYTLSLERFPQNLLLSFEAENIIQPREKNLLLKITGEGHYQFFNLYIVD
jgi:hypothetical protein